MTRRLVVQPEALEEIDEAARWYGSRSRKTSRRFLDAVNAAVEAVRLHPERYPIRERGTRHLVLAVFPYTIIYMVTDHEVVIISCFHQRRDPVEWYRRV